MNESKCYRPATGELQVIVDSASCKVYHGTALISKTYAQIAALKTALVDMMAQTIRDESGTYPRPVPLDMFEQPPFDLKPA
ncbi:MAG: hypothetical protein JSW39_00585 [Desulfobacterales bacterium]|nr:MAG: hypothetical protein JSW39_00585 [Desulfobacterales bacterium]